MDEIPHSPGLSARWLVSFHLVPNQHPPNSTKCSAVYVPLSCLVNLCRDTGQESGHAAAAAAVATEAGTEAPSPAHQGTPCTCSIRQESITCFPWNRPRSKNNLVEPNDGETSKKTICWTGRCWIWRTNDTAEYTAVGEPHWSAQNAWRQSQLLFIGDGTSRDQSTKLGQAKCESGVNTMRCIPMTMMVSYYGRVFSPMGGQKDQHSFVYTCNSRVIMEAYGRYWV